MGGKMLRKSALVLFFTGCIMSFSSVCYAANLEVKIQCPSSVTVGNPLDVTVVNIQNKDKNVEGKVQALPVSISKALVGFGGNMGNSVTGIGVFGPFSRSFNLTVQPGEVLTGPWVIRIIDKVPSSLAGKVAAAGVTFTNADYSSNFGGDGCGVEVVK